MKPTFKNIKFKGHPLVLYSSGILTTCLGITRITLLNWERLKIIPTPLLPMKDTQRWYIADEILTYKSLYQDAVQNAGFSKNRVNLEKLKSDLHVAKSFIAAKATKNPEELTTQLADYFHEGFKKARSIRKAHENAKKEEESKRDQNEGKHPSYPAR